MRVEGREIDDPPKAPEKLNWLLKSNIINQGKEGNRHRIRKEAAMAWSTENGTSAASSEVF